MSLIPIKWPKADSGFWPNVTIRCTAGNAPAKAMAIDATIAKPSVTGSISHSPVRIITPVISWKIPITRPTEIMKTRPLPNASNPLVMASGLNHRPTAISAAAKMIGTVWRSTQPAGMPAIRPETTTPIGMVTIPASTPRARKPRSSLLIMPSATGIVNTIVAPIMAPRTRPDSFCASGLSVSA